LGYAKGKGYKIRNLIFAGWSPRNIFVFWDVTPGCQRREYQNYLWIGYHRREGKEDVEEKHGWKEYKQP